MFQSPTRQFETILMNIPFCLHLIISGVPQGSALSPILFNIFTFELPSILTESPVMRCKVFADDTKVFKSFSNGESNEELQKCLDKMYKWSVDWGLPLTK